MPPCTSCNTHPTIVKPVFLHISVKPFECTSTNAHIKTSGVFIINIYIYIWIYQYTYTHIYIFTCLFSSYPTNARQWLTNWFHPTKRPLNRLIGATCGLPNFQQFAQLLLCHTHPWRVFQTLLPKKKIPRILQVFFGKGTVVGNNLNITRWDPLLVIHGIIIPINSLIHGHNP